MLSSIRYNIRNLPIAHKLARFVREDGVAASIILNVFIGGTDKVALDDASGHASFR